MTDSSLPYLILNSGTRSPFIFNSPHSGREYPKSFLQASRLDPVSIRKSEDSFVEELFHPVVGLGATLIHARFPRAFVDVNREPFELDPQLFKEGIPPFANTQSLRVLGGLGTIARVVSESEEIYDKAPSLEEAIERINKFYWPYHNALRGLIEEARSYFGFAVLIDCHSMPSMAPQQGQFKPEFVLGDRFGSSCHGSVTQVAHDLLERMGYCVVRNTPYAGGYATEHYGRPAENVHALQIEVNRVLYMNESTIQKKQGFYAVRRDLQLLSEGIMEELPKILRPSSLAAE